MSEGIRPSTQGELGLASGCCECSPNWWALGGGWALEKQEQLSSWPCLATSRKSSQDLKHQIKYQTPCCELQLEVSSLKKHQLFVWLFHIISFLGLQQVSCPLLLFLLISWGWQNGGARKSALCHAEQLMTWVERCVRACMNGIHVCGSSFANSASSKGHSRRKVPATQPHAVLKARGNLMLNYAGSSLTGSLLPIDAFFFFRTASYLSLKTERSVALGGEFNLLASTPTSTRVSRCLTCELLTLPLPPSNWRIAQCFWIIELFPALLWEFWISLCF